MTPAKRDVPLKSHHPQNVRKAVCPSVLSKMDPLFHARIKSSYRETAREQHESFLDLRSQVRDFTPVDGPATGQNMQTDRMLPRMYLSQQLSHRPNKYVQCIPHRGHLVPQLHWQYKKQECYFSFRFPQSIGLSPEGRSVVTQLFNLL